MNTFLQKLMYLMLALAVVLTTLRPELVVSAKNNFQEIACSTQAHTSQKDNPQTDNKQTSDEKGPFSFHTTQFSQATLQSIIPFTGFYFAIPAYSIELQKPFFDNLFRLISYRFSTSIFFKTLFRCYISTNAP